MNDPTDLLERVVAALEARRGDLPTVARESGVPYDTVLRIKNRENDPGYSRVVKLAAYLFVATGGEEQRESAKAA